MRELWPEPTPDLAIEERLGADPRPKPDGRPWVTLIMIMTIDGAIAIDGVSGGLGGPADQEQFLAARRQADAIIVGASTVAVENYRPTANTLAIVTGSLSPDPAARVFGDLDRKPLLYTTTQAARTRGADFDGIAELVVLGDSINPTAILADLDDRGVSHAVLEGGPTVNGLFLQHDLVDEMLLTMAPLVAGGDGSGLVRGAEIADALRFRLDRVLIHDDLLFVRYLRHR